MLLGRFEPGVTRGKYGLKLLTIVRFRVPVIKSCGASQSNPGAITIHAVHRADLLSTEMHRC